MAQKIATTLETTLSSLAKRLVHWKLLSEEQAREAQLEAQKRNLALIQYLVQQELIDPHAVAERLAFEFKLPLIDLRGIDWD